MRPSAGSRAVAWLETGTASPHQECPSRRSTFDRGGPVFIIGIDPHKGSHTAAVIDGDEQLVGEVLVCADRRQRERLLRWASPFAPRLWAIEGATGHGALLAQQLVAVGESVVDVPAALSARARLLDSGRKDKTDAHDARSAAIVALRHRNLREVALEDHRQDSAAVGPTPPPAHCGTDPCDLSFACRARGDG